MKDFRPERNRPFIQEGPCCLFAKAIPDSQRQFLENSTPAASRQLLEQQHSLICTVAQVSARANHRPDFSATINQKVDTRERFKLSVIRRWMHLETISSERYESLWELLKNSLERNSILLTYIKSYRSHVKKLVICMTSRDLMSTSN